MRVLTDIMFVFFKVGYIVHIIALSGLVTYKEGGGAVEYEAAIYILMESLFIF